MREYEEVGSKLPFFDNVGVLIVNFPSEIEFLFELIIVSRTQIIPAGHKARTENT